MNVQDNYIPIYKDNRLGTIVVYLKKSSYNSVTTILKYTDSVFLSDLDKEYCSREANLLCSMGLQSINPS